MPEHHHVDTVKRSLTDRYERLERTRSVGPLVAIVKRFLAIDGFTHGGLLAIELFTTVIPLMILGFSYFTGFASTANIGDLFVDILGLGGAETAQVHALFGTSAGLKSSWTVLGVAGFLVWGIPMSITVAAMYARAWRREQFTFARKLWRGGTWFLIYLATQVARAEVTSARHAGFGRVAFGVGAIAVVWAFWSLTPVLLVRDGARGAKSLFIAGLAGVVIDGVILTIAARIALPILLSGWTGFGPIGVAMTIMTWCGVLGIGWVVTACAGAVLWERDAPIDLVLDTNTEELPSDQPAG